MRIAIGTLSPPKIEAIKSAIKDCSYFNQLKIEIIAEKVNSDVSDMPLSLNEVILGAKNRASNLKNKDIQADFFVGMEGGVNIIGRKSYLFGVVHIIHNGGEEHLGISPMMEVPELFHKRVYENGEELGHVLHEVTGIKKTNKNGGSFGMWSDNMITRKDQFALAFLTAITPFYNKYYKL